MLTGEGSVLLGKGQMDDRYDNVLQVLREAKRLARRYRELTGKPLGITGEIAEYEAARLLDLELAVARTAGYDAVEVVNGMPRKLQIKGRCMLNGCKPGQRLGSIRGEHEWDAVLMVLLDENLNATAIYEAERVDVLRVLSQPGSRARNERGAMPVSKFMKIGKKRWPVEP